MALGDGYERAQQRRRDEIEMCEIALAGLMALREDAVKDFRLLGDANEDPVASCARIRLVQLNAHIGVLVGEYNRLTWNGTRG